MLILIRILCSIIEYYCINMMLYIEYYCINMMLYKLINIYIVSLSVVSGMAPIALLHYFQELYNCLSPAYLNSMLTPVINPRQLPSTSNGLLYSPPVKTKPKRELY